MQHLTPWSVDPIKVRTRRERATILGNLRSRAATSNQARMNLTIIRLTCCAGLRVSEIRALTFDEVRVDSGRSHLRVRPKGAKGGEGRILPPWWDAETLSDLRSWKREREEQGARPHEAFVCCLKPSRSGE